MYGNVGRSYAESDVIVAAVGDRVCCKLCQNEDDLGTARESSCEKEVRRWMSNAGTMEDFVTTCSFASHLLHA